MGVLDLLPEWRQRAEALGLDAPALSAVVRRARALEAPTPGSPEAHRLYERMGSTRYAIAMSLFLVMMLMPIKMFCRWLFNLKYFVHIQEFFFNI